uniref:Protein TsetseEP domain-containing protein n=1 Tax=Anopheles minimus TaxID=112268 RepID=A0A182WQT5_9DIPT
MLPVNWKLVLCTFCLFCAFATALSEDVPVIVQYQEQFSEYATILEHTMQIKRQANSNATLYFNIELLKLLSNATIEMRLIDNTTESTILQSASISQPCRQLVLELFKVFRTIGQAEFQGCAAYATNELHYWTTQRFFSYANIVHREATEHIHRVALILEQYNKITQMDNIVDVLSEEYYRFNNYNNALQVVLNRELDRFAPPDHPLREALYDCLDTTVTLHQLDMEYVLSYIDSGCMNVADAI